MLGCLYSILRKIIIAWIICMALLLLLIAITNMNNIPQNPTPSPPQTPPPQPPAEKPPVQQDKFYWPIRDKNGNPIGEILFGYLGRYFIEDPEIYHLGIDIGIKGLNGRYIRGCGCIYPIADGRVVKICPPNDPFNAGIGHSILIEHDIKWKGRTLYSMYCHMEDCPKLAKGQHVEGGKTILGSVSCTGCRYSSIPDHLHLETHFFNDWGHPDNTYEGRIKYGYAYYYKERKALFDDNWINPIDENLLMDLLPEQYKIDESDCAPCSSR